MKIAFRPSTVLRYLKSLPHFLGRNFSRIFGKWTPPGWFVRNMEASRGKPRLRQGFLVGAVLVTAIAIFGLTYRSKPAHPSVTYTLSSPDVTRDYIDSLYINFSESCAAVHLLNRSVNDLVTLSPSLSGVWTWNGESSLAFKPNQPWPAGTTFKIKMDTRLFSPGKKFDRLKFDWMTPRLSVRWEEAKLYIDPLEPSTRQVTATLRSNYSIRSEDLLKKLTWKITGDSNLFDLVAGQKTFEVNSDPHNRRVLYVRSAKLKFPDLDSFIRIQAGKGFCDSGEKDRIEEAVTAEVNITDASSIFRCQPATIKLVRNGNNRSEQILMIDTTAPLDAKQLSEKITVQLLPKYSQPVRLNHEPDADTDSDEETTPAPEIVWNNESQVTPDILKRCEPVPFIPLTSGEEYSTSLMGRIAVPENRAVLVTLPAGVEARGGYRLAKTYRSVVAVPSYEKEISVEGEGAVLAVSGERKISVASRGLPVLEFRLNRILDNQINHLVTQAEGSYTSPYFRSYTFSADNISEVLTEQVTLNSQDGSRPDYTPLNLTRYLTAAGGGQPGHGLFLLEIKGLDKLRPAPRKNNDDPDEPQPRELATETRFLLLTDLAMIIKKNADGTQDVFVQSFRTGKPVGDARVEVLGCNGLAVTTATTSDDGKASLPSLDTLVREKRPVAYIVRKGGDLSFLPFNRAEHELNYSRYDIGGDFPQKPDALNALIFTDRGLYRPGEEVRIGAIVRQINWKGSLPGLPLLATLTDPRGRVIEKKNVSLPESGFYDWSFTPAPGAPCGDYTVRLELARNKTASLYLNHATFRVNEFLPDRLKITATPTHPRPRGWMSPGHMSFNILLKNLDGTPADGHRIKGSYRLIPSSFEFASYPDYKFNDPYHNDRTNYYEHDFAEQKTDTNGDACVAAPWPLNSQSAYRFEYLVEGFEKVGGRSVKAGGSIEVSPMPYLMGIKLDGELRYIRKGQARKLSLVAINPDLQPLALENVTCKIFERRHLSVLTRNPNGNYAYQSVIKETLAKEQTLSLPAAGLVFDLPTETAGEWIVRFTDAQAHCLGELEYHVSGEGALSRPLDRNAELQVKLSRTEVSPGESLELQIIAPYTGYGLITLERDRVYTHTWFHAGTASTVQKITVPKDFEGNGYLNVTFTRALDSKEIFMSPLSSAVVPFTVNRSARTLKIDLKVPELARPGEAMEISYATSKPSEIIVYAVDEGILQTARYTMPDPVGYFLRKRALQVRTSQLASLLLPEFSLLKSLSAAGGDGDLESLADQLNPFKRKNIAPVVFWSGRMAAGPVEKKMTLPMPDHFDGSLRIMAVAVSPEAMGSAQITCPVRGTLALRPNVPTFMSPGDVCELTTTVVRHMDSTASTSQCDVTLEVADNLKILSPAVQTVTVEPGQEESVSYKVQAMGKPGEVSLKLTARLGDESRTSSQSMSVRPASAFVTTVTSGRLQGGKETLPITRDLHDFGARQELTLSPIPLGMAAGLAGYLQDYPHLCSEQLSSHALATIALDGVPSFGLPRSETQKYVNKTMAVLASRQNNRGAFGLWYLQDGLEFDFPSLYATHFLMEASESDFSVPDSLLDKALEHLTEMAKGTPLSLEEVRNQAYAIYLLTRSGVVTSSYLARLRETLDKNYSGVWKQDTTALFCAASYDLMHNRKEAVRIFEAFRARPDEATMNGETWQYRDFHSPLTRNALYVYLLGRHFPEKISTLTPDDWNTITDPIKENRFSTLSAAYCLLALKSCSSTIGAPDFNPSVTEIDGSGAKTNQNPSGSGMIKLPISSTTREVKIKGHSGQPLLYYQLTQSGFDRQPVTIAEFHGLEVYRQITGKDGLPANVVKCGDELTVTIRVRSTGAQGNPQVAVVDLLPGGFEVENESVKKLETQERGGAVNAREDRVLIYTTVTNAIREYRYTIKAVNPGTYRIPAIMAEAMYDRAVTGHGESGQITVVKVN